MSKQASKEEQQEQRIREIRERLEALAGEQGEEACQLLTELDHQYMSGRAEALDELWRQVGSFVVGYGAAHLYQALFIRHAEYYALSDGDYRPNEEWRFLWRDDWRAALKLYGITPTPEPAR